MIVKDPVKANDVFKGLPRRVHIGPRTYRIKLANPDNDADMLENYGMTHHEEFRIVLAEDMPAMLAAEIVQHEVSHCINAVYNVEDGADEEFAVTQHSRGITEVWIRNPRLHNWMIKTIRRARKEASHD